MTFSRNWFLVCCCSRMSSQRHRRAVSSAQFLSAFFWFAYVTFTVKNFFQRIDDLWRIASAGNFLFFRSQRLNRLTRFFCIFSKSNIVASDMEVRTYGECVLTMNWTRGKKSQGREEFFVAIQYVNGFLARQSTQSPQRRIRSTFLWGANFVPCA